MNDKQAESFKQEIFTLIEEQNEANLKQHGAIIKSQNELRKVVEPLVTEKQGRDVLDEKVDRWLRRGAWMVPIISSIIIVIYQFYNVVMDWAIKITGPR